jgi:hypothetical protein
MSPNKSLRLAIDESHFSRSLFKAQNDAIVEALAIELCFDEFARFVQYLLRFLAALYKIIRSVERNLPSCDNEEVSGWRIAFRRLERLRRRSVEQR